MLNLIKKDLIITGELDIFMPIMAPRLYAVAKARGGKNAQDLPPTPKLNREAILLITPIREKE